MSVEWPSDATVYISLGSFASGGQRAESTYGLYYGMINHLSPTFFTSVVEEAEPTADSKDVRTASKNKFYIKEGLHISKEEFDVFASYLFHDIDIYTAPFLALLNLFVVTSPSKCNFPTVHKTSSSRIDDLVFRSPDLFALRYDLVDNAPGNDDRTLRLLESAVRVATAVESELMESLTKPLKKLLYYIHTVIDIQESTDIPEQRAQVALALTADLSEAISPTLFTPPPAQHISCTDTIARLWSDRAVLPVLSQAVPEPAASTGLDSRPLGALRKRLRPRGMADVFGMLGAWVEDEWEDKDGKVCEECLIQLRNEWADEAKAVWEKMDVWVEKIEHSLDNIDIDK